MKRILSGIIALCFLTVFVVSQNKSWMEHIADWRFSHLAFAPDKYKFGDLYGMCFLQQYKESIEVNSFQKHPVDSSIRNHLYIASDSYLKEPMELAYFENISSLKQFDYRADQHTSIDTTANNILIIETAERFARWRLDSTNYFMRKMKIHSPVKYNSEEKKATPSNKKIIDTISYWKRFKQKCFNPNIDNNIEFNLYDYSALSPIRGFKTYVNYIFLNKISPKVAVSTDKKYLLLKETIDTAASTSSFKKLDDKELLRIVKTMNALQDSFMRKGFSKVIFSIVPNPATIIDSTRNTYNRLLVRLPAHDSLKVPYINVYPVFKNRPNDVYLHGDSHWNHKGKQLWFDEANKLLKTL